MSTAATVGRNTAVQVAGEIVGKIASVAFYLVMARRLGQDGFGAFMFALSLALLTTTFAGFGTDALVTRDVAREPDRHRLFWPAIAVKLTVGCAAVAAAILITVISGWSGSVTAAVAILAVAALVELLSKTVYATFQGLEDMRPVAVALLLQRLLTAAAGIGALLAGAELVAVAAIYLGGALAAQVWAQRRLRARGVRPVRELSRRRAVALARESAPIGLATLLGTALFRIDTTILGLLKDEAAVGVYSAAYRLLETTLFLSYAFGAALLPALSRAGRDTQPSLGDLYALGAKAVLAVLVPVGIVFALFAEPIIRLLYGDEYRDATTALRLLGGAAALYGLSYLSSLTLIACDRQRLLVWVVGAVLVQNVVLNLALIPAHSYDAAAFATSVSEATMALAFAALVVRESGRIALARVIAAPLAGALAMLAVAAAGPETLVLAAVALVAYAVAAIAVERLVFPADLRRVSSLLARRGAAAPASSEAAPDADARG